MQAHRVAAHLSLVLVAGLALSACQNDKPTPEDDTGAPGGTDGICETLTTVDAGDIVADTSESGYACRADFEYDPDCTDKVYGVNLEGVGTAPSSVKIVPPADCDPVGGGSSYVDSSPDAGWDSFDGYQTACPDVDNNTSSLTCSSAMQAQSEVWSVYLPSGAEACSDWGDLDLTFLIPSEDSCDPPADTPHDVCQTADDAPAIFVHRNLFDEGLDGSSHTHILPVMENQANNYSERTWIRQVDVTDWGDATKLYILKKGYAIHYNGDAVVEDSGIIVMDSQQPLVNLDEGVAYMGTTFATNSMTTSDTTWEPPSVTFDWSCGVPTPAHFSEIQGLPQAYAKRLDDLGIQGVTQEHRAKLRIFANEGFATVELEGRFHDRIAIPITASGSDWTFDYNDAGSIGIDAAGTISSSGSNKVVDFDRLILRGHDLGTPTWTLPPFSE